MATAWLLVILLTIILFGVAALKEKKSSLLPPGPPVLLFLAKFLWLRRSIFDIEPLLRELSARYGPLITIRLGSQTTIFIADRALAHHALVQMGAAFADRPTPSEAESMLSSGQYNVNSAPYGPRWRALRRNLAAEILQPSRVKLFAPARRWVLDILLERLDAQAAAGDGSVAVLESFQYAMFCLLVLMCFGEKLGEEAIRDIEAVQRYLLLSFTKLDVFAFLPKIAKLVFRRRWSGLVAARRRQEDIFIPLIRARAKALAQREREAKQSSGFAYSYVDSLLELRLPEEGGRKLREEEMASLCSEFLNAGTDTTATALQWIMANLVKRPDIQERIFREVEAEGKGERIEEEELQRMPYVRAVVLEALRRHPPGHFLLPHAVTEDVRLGGYVIPRGAAVNVAVAEVGWDEKAWAEPMEFRPERFMAGGEGEGVDVGGGGREVMRMMPFGAGRRACPGYLLALLHLEYFVANLVSGFEWRAAEGVELDMEEKLEFTVVMKTPLRAIMVPRSRTAS